MLSYFGCDQSQVQRYLTARSVDEGRQSLMMSAYVKIPLQAVILMTGVLVFAFYLFARPPMLFNPKVDAELRASPAASEYLSLEQRYGATLDQRTSAARAAVEARASNDPVRVEHSVSAFKDAVRAADAVRADAVKFAEGHTAGGRYNDVNYVFPTFIITHLPPGLVGLLIAAIFAAAMSASAAELNSLSTATVIDFYRRHLKPDATEAHYLRVSRVATGLWGLVACMVAIYATTLGSLIEVVNRFGSFFYGSLLGVFVLAIGTRRATGTGAFAGSDRGHERRGVRRVPLPCDLVSLAQRGRRVRGDGGRHGWSALRQPRPCSRNRLVHLTYDPAMTEARPLVAVIMGSKSDWETMRHADEVLTTFGVPHECRVVSAHRTPGLHGRVRAECGSRRHSDHHRRRWRSRTSAWDGRGIHDAARARRTDREPHAPRRGLAALDRPDAAWCVRSARWPSASPEPQTRHSSRSASSPRTTLHYVIA